ncbi:hypothetical protein [Dyadobacter sandarakinus]|uniref:Uncharacterized protein n=1 Tax=Dyadobacter sandarakinus TaxID=2747268 RepID=A0ABX7I7M1_9BACT|nr:hypothetical protein [Dyadobacter sandarakinus]QRR00981.1 hypothetical protein HWI92_08750 [Dyadobacter sandarakinus]
MPQVDNQDPNGKVEAGVTLHIKGAESENDATLAVENYLRVNKKEELEFAIKDGGAEGDYLVTLG